jgi:hypothetical protein
MAFLIVAEQSWPWGTAFWQEGYAGREEIGREQAQSGPGPNR